MKKYNIKTMTYGELKGRIDLPRFQRSPVWSDSKKSGLIETIKKGLPIGSLLLSRNEKSDNYQLIDGLQRISTLKDFEKNKFKYISDDEITPEDIESIINSDQTSEGYNYITQFGKGSPARNALELDIKKTLIHYINGMKENSINDTGWTILEQLKNNALLGSYSDRQLYTSINNILSKINNLLDITKLELPLIIYNDIGSQSDLIDIFTKMNSEGVQLSKYDIFSASWQDIEINVSGSDALINYVIEKYKDSSEKSGLEIKDFDPDEISKSGIINLFEYAYALSKLISDNSKFLYSARSNSQVDSLGFTLLAGIFGVPNSKMGNLADVISSYDINFVDLSNSVIECLTLIENKLSLWATNEKGGNYSTHSELQLASYIILVHKLTYKLDDGVLVKDKRNQNLRTFLDHLHKHYIYDILRGYWAGSGDSKLEEIITNVDTNRYLSDVGRDAMESTILSWLEEQNLKNRRTISTDSKLFLNYLHTTSHKSHILSKFQFDFDHIIPKSVLDKYFTASNINFSMSTPANLSLIPAFDNRSKRELTYYQLLESKTNNIELNEAQLDDCCYPKRSDIRFVESKDSLNITNYKKFLEERSKFLTHWC